MPVLVLESVSLLGTTSIPGVSLQLYSLFLTCFIHFLPSNILSRTLPTLTVHFCQNPVCRLLDWQYWSNVVNLNVALTTSDYTSLS